MEAIEIYQPLNAMQIHFLQSLRFVKTDEMFQELRQIISDYYLKKLEEETDKWWKENSMTSEKFKKMFSYLQTTDSAARQ